ncbi:MAG TPA: cell division/cell wall cluster transcriptional repressor MraZ [Elusimicrobia bacterium]|nr:MAG: cell division/cell wall cluster transcriptional repressor MraZ [Elusimicrobia bacterium RIFOXYD2_FULL_34_30]HAM38758.1 cell division/cell wall cluster transcriptional repressor MraZ [Elusimicrobiota bacterium]
MLIGLYEYSIDVKGRLFIPAKFREGKNRTFIVTIGIDRCLYVYPNEKWSKLEDKLENLPFKDKSEERAFKRILLSGATEVVADFQGRILLPYNLRQYAFLKNNVVIIGVSNRIEIWAKDLWNKYSKTTKALFSKHANSLEI